MKIVVIGGSGLIGRHLLPLLKNAGHTAVSASPSSGVNTLTGQGLDEVLAGSDVIVDVSNSPSFADQAVMDFFTTSTSNLLRAARTAGVRHYVALSVVGADRLPDSGYMRAKVAQEELIRASTLPFTIVRATQFFEFLGTIAYGATTGDVVTLPTAPMQPVAAIDVALALADVAAAAPVNRIVELAGPESLPMYEFVGRYLKATHDPRHVVADTRSDYFGASLDELGLNPGANPRLGQITFAAWMDSQPVAAVSADTSPAAVAAH